MVTSLKIAFIGEAVSGFGGMETVISNVIHTLKIALRRSTVKCFSFVVMTKWIKHG